MLQQSPQTLESLSARVLVVDDDASIRELLRVHLSKAGYEVLLASDGDEAVEMAVREHPDLVLVDLFMPRLGGFETTQQLRHTESTADIPIVMISGSGNPQERAQALDTGVDDFIGKPFDRIELLARVRSLLRMSRLRRSLVETNGELQSAYDHARDAESRYHSLVNDSLDAVFVVNAETSSICEVNGAAAELLGKSNGEILGLNFDVIFPGLPAAPYTNPVEVTVTPRPDVSVLVLIRSSHVRSLRADLIQYTIRDISAARKLQEAHLNEERLATIVETAVTVNEEVNSPLSVIIGSAESLRKGMREVDSKAFTRIDHILEAARRIQDSVARLVLVQRPISKEYLPGTRMLDLDEAMKGSDEPE